MTARSGFQWRPSKLVSKMLHAPPGVYIGRQFRVSHLNFAVINMQYV